MKLIFGILIFLYSFPTMIIYELIPFLLRSNGILDWDFLTKDESEQQEEQETKKRTFHQIFFHCMMSTFIWIGSYIWYFYV